MFTDAAGHGHRAARPRWRAGDSHRWHSGHGGRRSRRLRHLVGEGDAKPVAGIDVQGRRLRAIAVDEAIQRIAILIRRRLVLETDLQHAVPAKEVFRGGNRAADGKTRTGLRVLSETTNRERQHEYRQTESFWAQLECLPFHDFLMGPLFLKCELRANLDQPGRRSTDDLAERCAADVTVDGLRTEELGVVEDVECFQPQL